MLNVLCKMFLVERSEKTLSLTFPLPPDIFKTWSSTTWLFQEGHHAEFPTAGKWQVQSLSFLKQMAPAWQFPVFSEFSRSCKSSGRQSESSKLSRSLGLSRSQINSSKCSPSWFPAPAECCESPPLAKLEAITPSFCYLKLQYLPSL